MTDATSTESLLHEAITRLAGVDEGLAGATPVKWIVVAEHEWAEEGEKTLSVFRSSDQPPWEALGLLRFATLQEEERALLGPMGDDA